MSRFEIHKVVVNDLEAKVIEVVGTARNAHMAWMDFSRICKHMASGEGEEAYIVRLVEYEGEGFGFVRAALYGDRRPLRVSAIQSPEHAFFGWGMSMPRLPDDQLRDAAMDAVLAYTYELVREGTSTCVTVDGKVTTWVNWFLNKYWPLRKK